MVRKEYKKIVFSLHSLADLIKISGRDIKHEFAELEQDILLIKKKKPIDYDRFEKNVTLLLQHLEELKKYNNHVEFDEASHLADFFSTCVHARIDGLSKQDAELLQKNIDDLLSLIAGDFKKQVSFERKLKHRKRLRFFKFFSSRHLAKQEHSGGILLDTIERKKSIEITDILKVLHHLESSSLSQDDMHRFSLLVLEYFHSLREEFKTVFSLQEKDAEQEEVLEEKLSLSSSDAHLQPILEKLQKEYISFMKNDFLVAKRLRDESLAHLQKERNNFLKTLSVAAAGVAAGPSFLKAAASSGFSLVNDARIPVVFVGLVEELNNLPNLGLPRNTVYNALDPFLKKHSHSLLCLCNDTLFWFKGNEMQKALQQKLFSLTTGTSSFLARFPEMISYVQKTLGVPMNSVVFHVVITRSENAIIARSKTFYNRLQKFGISEDQVIFYVNEWGSHKAKHLLSCKIIPFS